MVTITAQFLTATEDAIEGEPGLIRFFNTGTDPVTIEFDGFDGPGSVTTSFSADPEITGYYADWSFLIKDDTLVDSGRSLYITKINNSTDFSGFDFSSPIISYSVTDVVQEDKFDLSATEDVFDEIAGLQMYKWTISLDRELPFDLNIELYWHGWFTVPAGSLSGSVVTYHPVDAVLDYSPKPIYEQIAHAWWQPVSLLGY